MLGFIIVLALWLNSVSNPNIRGGIRTLQINSATDNQVLNQAIDRQLEQKRTEIIKARRKTQINKVERLFKKYRNGKSPLIGYGSIIVDQAQACGGDYQILIGIAGSESGLGYSMYKRYNPYGFLNGVQYPNLETALKELSCLVSRNHISVCKTDLTCLARRYTGPKDDKQHFISKIRWFMNQVD